MDINPSAFLWPEEEKLVLFLIQAQEAAIAWDPTEHGNFQKDYFELVVIPTVEHIPWVERNIPSAFLVTPRCLVFLVLPFPVWPCSVVETLLTSLSPSSSAVISSSHRLSPLPRFSLTMCSPSVRGVCMTMIISILACAMPL